MKLTLNINLTVINLLLLWL